MTTATKGADLPRRMYALGPTALADEAASLLWDDGRRSPVSYTHLTLPTKA